jgi:hypothetical protein
MAISQTRMLALLKISSDFKDLLLSTHRNISDAIRALPPQPTPDELLSTIQTIQAITNLITINPQALEILANENAHFKLNAQRNTRQMLRNRAKRHATPTPYKLLPGEAPPAEYLTPGKTAPAAIGTKTPEGFSQYFDKSTVLAVPKDPIPATPTHYGAAARYNKTLSDRQLSQHMNIELADQKHAINQAWTALGQPAPFPDLYNDDEPLSLDHKIHLGLPTDDEGVF